ncbi:MAG: YceD family protein [Paracoccaceae bacterium]
MTEYLSPDTNLPPWSQRLRVSELHHNRTRRFEVRPDAAILKTIAVELGLLRLNKLRFTGEIGATGKSDWKLSATLGATVHQPCVVTLEPVTTRIDREVERLFVSDVPDYEAGSEYEMPEDDSVDILENYIDLGEIMVEVLALHLPAYPRANGVEAENAVFTEPGKTPMSDNEARPFAGLEALRDKLTKEDD